MGRIFQFPLSVLVFVLIHLTIYKFFLKINIPLIKYLTRSIQILIGISLGVRLPENFLFVIWSILPQLILVSCINIIIFTGFIFITKIYLKADAKTVLFAFVPAGIGEVSMMIDEHDVDKNLIIFSHISRVLVIIAMIIIIIS